MEPVHDLLKLVDIYDITYNGYNGQAIKGWYVQPKGTKEPLPCVVEFIGYGGGRSYAHDWLLFANAGYGNFIMDTRGQGSVWQTGDTPDIEDFPSNPQTPGFMTRGITNPDNYYYRRVFTDAVRAVEAARSIPTVNSKQIILSGASQAGGICLAVSGLLQDLLGIMPEVPFLCHYKRAVDLTDQYPYQEITTYLKVHHNQTDTVFKTLSYFDGVNFAARANAKALFSVGLMDTICPPSTVFAAYNHYNGQKNISVYHYNQHEGGGVYHEIQKLNFIKSLLIGMVCFF